MQSLYQSLPSIDKLISTTIGLQLIDSYGHQAVVNQLRSILHEARFIIAKHNKLPIFVSNDEAIYKKVRFELSQQQQVAMKKVHNLTGTVLHTNLGRAPWSRAAQLAAIDAMSTNVALEYDLNQGERSHRDQYISELLAKLCGAEAACIVNNNAAAVLLMLSALGKNKEVIISRGELVEIGGAFRIPDIMEQAGAQLIEVGTTNRTHLKDYKEKISEQTALLMKVHTSNYQIMGFTHSVSEKELAQLAFEKQIYTVADLGSGALTNLEEFGLPHEPTVKDMLADGVDLISFSGDKLLGGPQAGIIVGKKELIEQLQHHPLKRALRCDKVILSGLEATIRQYFFPEKLSKMIPTFNLLTLSTQELYQRAEALQSILYEKLSEDYHIEIAKSEAQIGSGSQPTHRLPSYAVTIMSKVQKDTEILHLNRSFKQLSQPIIGRIESNKLWLDVRSVVDIDQLIQVIEEL